MSGTTEEAVVREALTWFHGAWDPDLSLLEWRGLLVDSGWAVPSWSSDRFGRDLPAWADRVAHAAIRRAGGVAVPLGGGFALAAPTMYEYASDALKQKYLRRTLTGELAWCQLFSEPGAGSDLAGLKTTADRDGDEWVVNGQKVWNTSADHADMAILVARTDWDAVKHAGLSYFLIDMHQDGVETRPIEQMNYHNSFNEVFLTDARVPHENLVGESGRWLEGGPRHPGSRAVVLDATQRLLRPLVHGSGGRGSQGRGRRVPQDLRVVPPADGPGGSRDRAGQALGRAADPVLRQELMKLISFQRASEWTAAGEGRSRARARSGFGGLDRQARSLRGSSTLQPCPQHDRRSPGHAEGEPTIPIDAVIAEVLVSTPAQSIAGGTDEIQHNIIGEGILGLPKEPATDRGMPFRDVGK